MDRFIRKPYVVGLCIAIALALIGFAAWLRIVSAGMLGTTGMSNVFNWGFLIAVFAFLVGFAAGAQILASYAVVFKRDELSACVFPAQAISLGASCGAGVAIVADLGAPWNILQMILHLNVSSPLAWDMMALTLFVFLSAASLVAVIRDSKAKTPLLLAAGASAIALQIVEGLLFALQEARAWWHSVAMPVDFLVVAIISGAAALVLVDMFSKDGRAHGATRVLCRVLTVSVCAHLLLTGVELALLALEESPESSMVMSLLSKYAELYGLEIALLFLAAVLAAVSRKSAMLPFVSGGLAILGLAAHRLMLLYPAFGATTLFVGLPGGEPRGWWAYPASTGLYPADGAAFAIVYSYAPSVLEVVSALLPLGVALAVVVIAYAVGKRPAEESPDSFLDGGSRFASWGSASERGR